MIPNGQKITCIIVDDNPIARESLAVLAGQIDDLQVMNTCEDAFQAYSYLQHNPVDLIFLDIEMPGMTGLELTGNLMGKRHLIVFTTSKKEHALEAFNLNVADYLVKPFSSQRFSSAVDKVRGMLIGKTENLAIGNDEFLFVRDGNVVRKIAVCEIRYTEAMGDYVKFFTADKLYTVHTTLKSIEERLPKHMFVRIHRSYIASLRYIETLQEGGMVIQGKFLPITDSYRKNLHRLMNII